MSCRIKLYEASRTLPRSHVSLRSPTVQLVAVEQASLANCCHVQANRRLLGGGYGADLPFIPAPFVYQVAIVDTAQIYAGATLSNLNGAMSVDLDMVLFHLPTVGLAAVAAGGAVAQVRVAVLTHPSWSPHEKQAVLSVMNALGSLSGTAATPVLGFLTRYEQALMDRGIDPGLY